MRSFYRISLTLGECLSCAKIALEPRPHVEENSGMTDSLAPFSTMPSLIFAIAKSFFALTDDVVTPSIVSIGIGRAVQLR